MTGRKISGFRSITAVLSAWKINLDVPNFSEILYFFEEKKLPMSVIAHSFAVTHTALQMAGCLPVHFYEKINLQLLTAASLLHDIERQQSEHAKKGAFFVYEKGYPNLAPLIAVHMDLSFQETDVLNETALLYLADKTCQGIKWISLEQRQALYIKKYGKVDAVEKRFAAAISVRKVFLQAVDPMIWKHQRLRSFLYAS